MSKEIEFSTKVLMNERFATYHESLTDEKKRDMIESLEQKYGGAIALIETVAHIYTPILTKNGDTHRRFKSLKDCIKGFLGLTK